MYVVRMWADLASVLGAEARENSATRERGARYFACRRKSTLSSAPAYVFAWRVCEGLRLRLVTNLLQLGDDFQIFRAPGGTLHFD